MRGSWHEFKLVVILASRVLVINLNCNGSAAGFAVDKSRNDFGFIALLTQCGKHILPRRTARHKGAYPLVINLNSRRQAVDYRADGR